MDAIHKILVPTDFSAHADEAFRVAHSLAALLGAEVIVFHIARPPAVVSEDGQLFTEPGTREPANLWERFHNLAASPKVRVKHEVIVADRPSANHVLDILDKFGCDLIVMGTHGRSWLKHRLFGSVTEDVVRRARCPVMVVKAPAQEPPPVANAPGSPGAAKAEDGRG
jgi:nucleotide-binding universal stress UspA family protein